MTKEKLQQRINELTAKRDEWLTQVNVTLGEFNGRIAALTELLHELDEEIETAVNGEVKEPEAA